MHIYNTSLVMVLGQSKSISEPQSTKFVTQIIKKMELILINLIKIKLKPIMQSFET